MNQGNLDVVKQKMARVNTNILTISELNKWEWANLIQTTILSPTVGKNPLEEMNQPSQSTEESEMQYLGAISKKKE